MDNVRRKTTKFTIAMTVSKLEGLPPGIEIATELRFKKKSKGRVFLFPSRRKSEIVSVSMLKRVERDGSVDWEIDGEASRIENASVDASDSDFGSDRDLMDVSIYVLCGYEGEGKLKENKLETIGTANLNIAEWIRVPKFKNIKESLFHEPITLRIGYVTYDANLYVNVKLVELVANKGSKILPSLSDSSTEFADFTNSKNGRGETENKNKESVSIPKQSFFTWRRRRKDLKESENNFSNNWESKVFICREALTKLKTQVFFASIDQRDCTAGGESACTALVAFITNYLLRKNFINPKKEDFDELIRNGSLEWRKLCKDERLIERFPDKHFDLETILKANITPIKVIDQKSFIGFFQPESFKSLNGATSFDEIWAQITKNIQENEVKVYIISWNDHFFVLKIEKDAFYIVDTLGERLFEGCRRAYILKFDDSSEMYKLNCKKNEDLIFRGKKCCREFIKRFLAAIPLKEELEIEKKGENIGLVRLQIEFHFVVLDENRYEDDILRERRAIELERD